VRERTEVKGLALTPIVVGYENQEAIQGAAPVGKGQVLVFSPDLGAANQQIQDWSYFNYLIYHLVMRAAGVAPLSFGDYPASPVPHEADRLLHSTLPEYITAARAALDESACRW
jgi:hypothetical protein